VTPAPDAAGTPAHRSPRHPNCRRERPARTKNHRPVCGGENSLGPAGVNTGPHEHRSVEVSGPATLAVIRLGEPADRPSRPIRGPRSGRSGRKGRGRGNRTPAADPANLGRLWAHYCRYLRVERPRLLEFTWMSEATRGLESRVTVEMTPSRGHTDLVLTHNGLPNDEMGRGHEEGWKKITGTLAERIKGLR